MVFFACVYIRSSIESHLPERCLFLNSPSVIAWHPLDFAYVGQCIMQLSTNVLVAPWLIQRPGKHKSDYHKENLSSKMPFLGWSV